MRSPKKFEIKIYLETNHDSIALNGRVEIARKAYFSTIRYPIFLATIILAEEPMAVIFFLKNEM